jgi:RNA polymerase sigma-70 factor (ECF subfamily)
LESNEKIIAGCKKNDRKAQQSLYEKFGPKMYGHCLRYAGNVEEAQDVLQDGFIKVFEKISSLKDANALEGWMSRIFINLALSYYRKRKSGPDLVEMEPLHEVLSEEQNIPNDDLDPKLVLKQIQSLPEKYRLVLNAYAIDGLSHKEIADLLETTESNTKSILSRARKMMRDWLNEKDNKN